jgi:thioesterase domain-containing protein
MTSWPQRAQASTELGSTMATAEALSGVRAADRAADLIFPLREEGDATPIFCAHSPLGSTGYYAKLAWSLQSRHAVYGINAVGAFGEGEPLDCFEQMAERYIAAIRSLRPHGPYILAGHSSGAYIAFEICLRLGSREAPRCIVLDQDAPRQDGFLPAQKRIAEPDQLGVLIRLLAVIATLQSRPLPDDADRMRQTFKEAPPERKFSILADWLKQLQLLPRNAGPEMAGGFLRSAAAHGHAESRWTLRGRRYDGRLCVVQARDLVDLPGVNVGVTDPGRYALWQQHCSRPIHHVHVTGNHLSLMVEPYVAETARCVQSFLMET